MNCGRPLRADARAPATTTAVKATAVKATAAPRELPAAPGHVTGMRGELDLTVSAWLVLYAQFTHGLPTRPY